MNLRVVILSYILSFSYLIKEQLNSLRMSEIKLSYLVENYPENLELDKELYRIMPSYANYENKIFRELRSIDEYSRLYLENYSYRHNILMPNFERLQITRQLISDILTRNNLLAQLNKGKKIGNQITNSLICDS